MDDYTIELIEELARVRAEAARWRAEASAMSEEIARTRRWVDQAPNHSRVAILTRLVGALQDENEAMRTVLRVGDEARELGEP